MDITIPAGYRKFKKELVVNLNKGLNVITGINGSGKTQLLEYIYSKKIQNNKEEIFLRKNNNSDYMKNRFLTRNRIYNRYDENYDININDILNEVQREYESCIYDFKLTQNYIYPEAFYNAIFVKDNFLYNYTSLDNVDSRKNIILRINEKEKSFKINFLKRIVRILSKNTHESEEKIAKNFGLISDYDLRFKLQEKFIKEDKIFKSRRDKEIKEYTNKYIETSDNYKEILKIKEDYFKRYNTIKNKVDFINYIDYLLAPLNSIDGIIIKLSNIIYNDAVKRAKNIRTKKIWKQINEILEKIEYSNFKYILEEPDLRIDYKISFKYKNNKNPEESIPFENLSSGEKIIFELICYIFITGYNDKKNKTKIILLDEFDANLNPQLSKLLIETIRNELIKRGIMVILTTHSPSTVALVEPNELYFMKEDKEEGRDIFQNAKDENGKKEILEELAPNFIYEPELGFLGILAKTSKKYIIFVEGESDKIHFETARKFLKLEDEYEFINCESADNINHIIKAIKDIQILQTITKNKIIIGLFDFDTKGREVVSKILNNKQAGNICPIKEVKEKIHKKEKLLFNLKNSSNIKLLMLTPCSNNNNFWGENDENYEVEHLYNTKEYSNKILMKSNNIDDDFFKNPEKFKAVDDKKIDFAKYVSEHPIYFKDSFESNFKRIFNIINTIQNNNNETNNVN